MELPPVSGRQRNNLHESDPRFGPLIETVRSFRLLLADGTVAPVSRSENAELFGLAIGGYGLFGIVLDAELALTEDRVYAKSERLVDYRGYAAFFAGERADPTVENVFARVSIAPGPSLLREVLVTTYRAVPEPREPHAALAAPRLVGLKRFLFGLSRRYTWGKRFRWWLQREHADWFEPRLITRNNLMRGDLAFLRHTAKGSTDILQEYFLPVDRLPEFVDALRESVMANRANLLSATIRYVPHNAESALSYSTTPESFGLVLYFNVGRSAAAQEEVTRWTRALIDRAEALGGTYYLPYRPYATREQFRRAYPRADELYRKKLQYDPEELFVNGFYVDYLRPVEPAPAGRSDR